MNMLSIKPVSMEIITISRNTHGIPLVILGIFDGSKNSKRNSWEYPVLFGNWIFFFKI